MKCQRCGSDHIELASVIVARETTQSTGSGRANGQYVTTHVTSKSARAQELTADEPKRKGCCLGTLLLLIVPTIGFLWSGLNLLYVDYADVPVANPEFQRTQWTTWLLASVLVWIAIIVVSVIVSRLRKISFKSRYQSWLNQYYRRYFCNNCGAIFQN